MNNYYEVKVKMQVETDGKIKNQNEKYLVEAVSITDVDAKINKEFSGVTFEWQVVSVRETHYVSIIN